MSPDAYLQTTESSPC